MVRVPQVSQQIGGSVQAQAPGVVQVQDQTGRQLQETGRAIQIAGTGVQRLGDTIKLRDDTARISEADSLFGDYVRSRLNPVDGYRSQMGKAAGDDYEQVRADLTAKREELGRNLSADQRVHFDRSAQARVSQAQGVVDSHAAHQTSIYTASQQSAAIKGYAADYVDSLGNPQAMARSMELMRRTVDAMGDTVGASAEQREQLMSEAMTSLHGSVVSGLIDEGDTQGAHDYLKAHEKAIEPGIRKKLKGQTSRLMANQKSADMAASMVDSAPKGASVDERRMHALGKAAEAIATKGLSIEESTRLMANLGRIHSQEVEVYAVTQNIEVQRAAEWFKSNPDATYEHYAGSIALDESGGGEKVRKWLAAGQQDVQTAPDKWMQLLMMKEGGRIGDGVFAGKTLGDLKPSEFNAVFSPLAMSKADYRTAQASYAKALGEADEQTWKILGDAELINETVRRMGVNLEEARKHPTGEDAQRYISAKIGMQEAIEEYGFPKDATLKEKRQFLESRVLKKWKRDVMGSDPDVSDDALLDTDSGYVEVMAPTIGGGLEKKLIYSDDIPEGIRAKLIANIEATGAVATPQSVAQKYVQRGEPKTDVEWDTPELSRKVIAKKREDAVAMKTKLDDLALEWMKVTDPIQYESIIKERNK